MVALLRSILLYLLSTNRITYSIDTIVVVGIRHAYSRPIHIANKKKSVEYPYI